MLSVFANFVFDGNKENYTVRRWKERTPFGFFFG